MCRSGAPKLLFCANELLRDSSNDVVLVDQTPLEHFDLLLELASVSFFVGSEGCCSILEEPPLPLIEHTGLKVVGFTDLTDGRVVQKVLSKDGYLLLGREMAAFLTGHVNLKGYLTDEGHESGFDWCKTDAPLRAHVVVGTTPEAPRPTQPENPAPTVPDLGCPDIEGWAV